MKTKSGNLDFAQDPIPVVDRAWEQVDDRTLMESVVKYAETQSPELRESMRELWYRLRLRFLRSICRWCSDAARDVLDAAYLVCIKDAPGWLENNRESFEKYSTRCVNRVTQEFYREQGKPVMAFQGRADDREPSAEDALSNLELIEALNEELRQMPERERRIIEARHLEGSSLVEIANRENVAVNTIKKYLDHACLMLQRRLKLKGFTFSLTGISMLVMCSAYSEASEKRLERLIDSAPALASGQPVPAGSIGPTTQSLYVGATEAARALSLTWWVGTGLVLTLIPTAIVLSFWNLPLKEQPKAIVPNAVLPRESAPLMPADPVIIPADPVRPPNVAEIAYSPPGRFPVTPTSGQIHTVSFEPLDLKIDFCWVPRGENQVTGFWMARTELTQGQWKVVAADGGFDEINPSGFRGDDLPVESITPNQAVAWTERLSKVTDIRVRLPTNEEWRHASGSLKPSQPREESELSKIAWYQKNSHLTTHPVGTREPNAYNLCDVFGNVFELVSVSTGGYEIRGGCWCYPDFWCTPDYPSKWPENNKAQGVGLRLIHQPSEY